MPLLRFFALCLPQLLILLPLAASLDLLGGWNHTDAGFNTMLLLFLVVPMVTLALLIAEVITYRRSHQQKPKQSSLFRVRLAIFLCAETLAINLAILTQVRL